MPDEFVVMEKIVVDSTVLGVGVPPPPDKTLSENCTVCDALFVSTLKYGILK